MPSEYILYELSVTADLELKINKHLKNIGLSERVYLKVYRSEGLQIL